MGNAHTGPTSGVTASGWEQNISLDGCGHVEFKGGMCLEHIGGQCLADFCCMPGCLLEAWGQGLFCLLSLSEGLQRSANCTRGSGVHGHLHASGRAAEHGMLG